MLDLATEFGTGAVLECIVTPWMRRERRVDRGRAMTDSLSAIQRTEFLFRQWPINRPTNYTCPQPMQCAQLGWGARDEHSPQIGDICATEDAWPDDVTYQASWVFRAGDRCFQMMEAPHEESLRPWLAAWNDLVEFEVVPVITSAEYWSTP